MRGIGLFFAENFIENYSNKDNYTDNDENCNFYKLDESGQKIELPKDDMMKYLLTISYFRENLSPELLSYAKQNDYNAFRTLIKSVYHSSVLYINIITNCYTVYIAT